MEKEERFTGSTVVLDNFTREEMLQIVSFVKQLVGNKDMIFIHPMKPKWKITSEIEEIDIKNGELVLASELEKNKNIDNA